MTHIRPDEIEPELIEKLLRISDTPERDSQKVQAGLSAFLSEAETYRDAVTNRKVGRHTGWIQKLNQSVFVKRKEYSPMSTLVTILLATSILFGAGGVTVAAAQGSQPEDVLYNLKLWSETARLDLTSDPETDFQLSLEFMGRRSDEIHLLMASGVTPPAQLLEEYQNQIEQTIRFALNMPDDQVKQSLELIRSRLVIQQQNMVQLADNSQADQNQQIIRIHQMLQTRVGWLDDGLVDLELLELDLTLQDGSGPEDQQTTGAGNPWTTGTPTPGSSYGLGTGDNLTNTPQAYDHSGNPYTTGTPTPGSGYGPGADQVPGTPSGQTGYKPTDAGSQNGQDAEAGQQATRQPGSFGNKGGNN